MGGRLQVGVEAPTYEDFSPFSWNDHYGDADRVAFQSAAILSPFRIALLAPKNGISGFHQVSSGYAPAHDVAPSIKPGSVRSYIPATMGIGRGASGARQRVILAIALLVFLFATIPVPMKLIQKSKSHSISESKSDLHSDGKKVPAMPEEAEKEQVKTDEEPAAVDESLGDELSKGAAEMEEPRGDPEEAQFELYLHEFNMAALALEERWRNAAEATKDIFAKHYVPRDEKGLPPSDPLEPLWQHAEALRAVLRQSEADENRDPACLAELRLVTAIIQAADRRLFFLNKSGEFARNAGIASPLHGLEKELLDINTFRQQKNDFADYASYLSMIRGRKTRITDPHGYLVPKGLAQKCANSVKLANMQVAHDALTAACFAEIRDMAVMEPTEGEQPLTVGREWFPMATGRSLFAMALLREALSKIEKIRADYVLSQQTSVSLANHWTITGVLSHLAKQDESNRIRLKDIRTIKQEIRKTWEETQGTSLSPDDLFSLALELL